MYPMELIGVKPKAAREKAKELLNSVGLDDDKLNRFPSMLSGGERQRVAIARALGTGASVILADEPTGNLDETNSRVVMELLQELAHERNYCVIVVTHDPLISSMADEVLHLSDGKLLN
jgi:putative ABC transport system ATP-binding protein